MTNNGTQRREDLFAGVLIGTAVGDALGLAVEGLSSGVIAKRFGRVDRYRLLGSVGWVSDDTEQSALVAQSIARAGGDVPGAVRAFRRAIVGWFWRLPWGVGLATLRACLRLTVGLSRSGVRSAGNGAAMRSAIVGAFYRDDTTREHAARSIAEVTHTDARAVDGAVFVANVVAAEGTGRERIVTALTRVRDRELRTAIESALALVDGGASMADAAKTLGSTGFVVHTLALASFSFAREESCAVHELLPELYAVGGDTDSIGAIVGAWLGARRGANGFPSRWVDRLQSGPFGLAHLRALATQLAEVDATQTPRATVHFNWLWAFVRNLLMYPVILAHGLRRLAPPYR